MCGCCGVACGSCCGREGQHCAASPRWLRRLGVHLAALETLPSSLLADPDWLSDSTCESGGSLVRCGLGCVLRGTVPLTVHPRTVLCSK